MRGQFRGVNTTTKRLADGTVKKYYYHRDTGMPLTGEPGTREFMASFAAAEKLILDRHAGTYNGLVRDHTASIEFGKRSLSYQKESIRMLTESEREFGNMPIAALEDPRVKRDFLDWRSRVAKVGGEREADNRLSVISSMLTWAVDNQRLAANTLKGFKRLYHSDRTDKIWLPENVDGFMSNAYVEMQRLMIGALHSGQRQGDLRHWAWSNYDGTAITIRQGKATRLGKRGRLVTIPCTKTLKRMLDGMPRTSTLIFTTKTGQPWGKRHLSKEWSAICLKAGVTDLTFNDTRGTAVTMLAEADCTVPQIAAITGHSFKTVESILEKYLSRTRALADQAIFKFENAKATKFANRLQTGPQKAAKGSSK